MYTPLQPDQSFQRTLSKEIVISGIGLFSGEQVEIRLIPSPPDNGILFRRIDLPKPIEIPASLDSVVRTPRCTILGTQGSSIHTVEHLLSALFSFQIDNLTIEVKGPEIPAGDGSALVFVNAILQAGICVQKMIKRHYSLSQPVVWSDGEIHLMALPSDTFSVSYTLHYPHSTYLKAQYVSLEVSSDSYRTEIAPARTFSLFEEIETMLKRGLVKGGGLNNAVIIQNDRVLNPEGVRFEDEMARHKVLDLIGDLSLIGKKFTAQIVATRSGHGPNILLAKLIKNHLVERNFECKQQNQLSSISSK